MTTFRDILGILDALKFLAPSSSISLPYSQRLPPPESEYASLLVALPHPVGHRGSVVTTVGLAEDVERVVDELGVSREELLQEPFERDERLRGNNHTGEQSWEGRFSIRLEGLRGIDKSVRSLHDCNKYTT